MHNFFTIWLDYNSKYPFSLSNIPSLLCSSRKDSTGKRLLLYTSKQKTGKYRTYHWWESKGRCWKNAALNIKAFALRNLSAFSNCCGFPFKPSAPLTNLIAFAYVKLQWTPRRFGWFRFFLFRFLSLTAVLNTAFVNSWDNFLVLGDLWKIQNPKCSFIRDGRASFCHQVTSTLLFLPDLDRAVLKCSPSRYDTRIVFLQPFRYALISVNFLGPRSVNC